MTISGKSFNSKVVGVTKRNAERKSRQTIIKDCRVGELLELLREPDNEFDANAVKVCRRNGQQIGYLNSNVARTIAPLLDEGETVHVCITDLTGGTADRRTRTVWVGQHLPRRSQY